MVLFWSSIFLVNIIAYLIPKNLPRWQLYATSTFAVFFQTIADNYFDYKWNLYGYFEKGVDGINGLVYTLGIFPAANIIFVTGWEWASKKGIWTKISYITMWTILATIYEHFSLKSGFLYYTKWTLWLSLIEYPFIFFILILNLIILQRLHGDIKN